jgi:hypothetical protein
VTVFNVIEVTIPGNPSDPDLPPGHDDESQTVTEYSNPQSGSP